MKRSRSRGKPISQYTYEEIWKILEESDGEDYFMDELEDLEDSNMSGELNPPREAETIDGIRDFINRDYLGDDLITNGDSVVLQDATRSMSSPDPGLPPLLENAECVLPVSNLTSADRESEVVAMPHVASQIQRPAVLPAQDVQLSPFQEPELLPMEQDIARIPQSEELNNRLPSAWASNILPLEKEVFTGYDNLKRQIQCFSADSDVWTIFCSIIDKEIIEMMTNQTNTYAAQLLEESTLKQNSRLKRWKDVTCNEMRKFIGVYLLTGILQFPTTECYWEKNRLYYHPLLHEISMTYDRFCLIQRCWHFADNRSAQIGRLFKIQPHL